MQVYVGIDVHKAKWVVSITTETFFYKTISVEPKAEALIAYLEHHFKGCTIHCTYEAGFSGFGLQRALRHEGMNCIVVNASDVAISQKDAVQKSDRSDSRNLCFQLRSGNLTGIYVPSQQQEQLRSLFRQRNTVVKLLREAKVLIRAQLAYYGIALPTQYDNTIWSKQKLQWIKERTWNYSTGRESLHSKLRLYEFAYRELLHISNELRAYVRKTYKTDYYLLRTVPGIGPLTAIALLSEVGDLRRFPSANHLCSYVGLVPSIYSSSDTVISRGLTPRSKNLLRSYLVEAAWQAVRTNMELQGYYLSHKGKPANKRIVKVARKLLLRARAVLVSGVPYKTDIVLTEKAL
ncbi:MAG: IS110 family transposase [Flavisolibacter sp.]|nr:IS110 family transposase [Flavisolibacter sp.]